MRHTLALRAPLRAMMMSSLLLLSASCSLYAPIPSFECEEDQECDPGWRCDRALRRCSPDPVVAPWWDASWRRRHELRAIAGTELAASVLEPIALPVHVDLNQVDLIGDQRGLDLVFVAQSPQGGFEVLPSELERWDEGAERAFFWVRFPRYVAGMSVWLYSGSAGAIVPERGEVWGPEARAIYHFASHASARVLDQSERADHLEMRDLHPTSFSAQQPGLGAAMRLGDLNLFDETVERLPRSTLSASALALEPGGELTLELLFVADLNHRGVVLSDEARCSGTQIALLPEDHPSGGDLFVRHARELGLCEAQVVTQFFVPIEEEQKQEGLWRGSLTVRVEEGAKMTLFFEGNRYTEGVLAGADREAPVGPLYLGAMPPGEDGTRFEGWFDELLIHRGALATNVIRLRALAMTSQALVFSFEPGEDRPN